MNQEKVNNSGASEAANLAWAITSVAETAANEEELRIGVEKLLEPTLQRLGISVQPRYERHIRRTILTAPGRADALYGQAIIEYEPPGKLSTGKGLSSTQEQLERYLIGLAGSGSQREATLRRVAGIGFDGHSIFFLRYRGDRPTSAEQVSPKLQSTQLPLLVEEAPKGSFSVAGPYTITEESIGQFLLHLRALRRRPLVAKELAREFGPAGEMAHKIVNSLYNRLTDCLTTPGSSFPRVDMLYEEWKRIFGIVYGQELVKAESDARALARLYHITEFTDLKPLLFAVHTYYALFMKLLAAELLSLQQGALLASIAEQLPALSGELLQSRMEELEKGAWFARQGIQNFLEADFFGWYLSVWNMDIEKSIRSLARALAEYEPATATLAPEATRDLLKNLYQDLVPQELRHDLGEYYTPDWLAELLLKEVGYTGNPDHRLLDPACGSGTFLVLAIRRILDYAQDSLAWRARGERELVSQILENVVGFDLNPLAVITARTNYLLALGPLARHLAGKDIPIYLCDSILTPQTQWHQQRPIEHQQDIPVPSTQKEFWIPKELVDKGQVNTLCRLLEQCVDSDYRIEEFVALGQRELRWENPLTERSLVELYEKVLQLKADKRNGLWARIIKNAFAPVFRSATPFDYVVGNPPWVNWESLANEYRDATRVLWQKYGLFSLKGHAARLGGGKKDVAMLMLYAAMDSYLKDGGKLGFVITQTVFKTKGAGDGFRRFRLGDGQELKVLKVNDMVELQPFEGASNRTSTVVLEKGKATDYPVTYTLWQKTKPGRIAVDSVLVEVEERTCRIDLAARPVNISECTSPWVTARLKALSALEKVIGKSDYQAHAGACTWLNGVYWLRILERRPEGLLVVENLNDVGKKKVKQVRMVIEPDLVYPLLRGRDVGRWQAKPSACILMVQDSQKRAGYDESWLKVQYPLTYAYLKEFENVLRERSGYKKYFDLQEDSFYSMYDVAEYTFAPYKVVWREQATSLTASVVGSHQGKPIIPDHKLMLIECLTASEAHYLCAMLNSNLAVFAAKCYAVETQTDTHIVENIRIPKFDSKNTSHLTLAKLSEQAHKLAAANDEKGLNLVEDEVDQAAGELWGLTGEELAEIKKSLDEIT
jgi:hypothetical protein